MKRSWFATPYVVWMALFTIAPLVVVLGYAFTSPEGGFTMANFQKFMDPLYVGILGLSLLLAAANTLICLALGYPAAYFLASKDFSRWTSLVVLFILPMWMNFLLRTYAWMSILEDNGLINRFLRLLGFEGFQMLYSEGAVLLGMVYNFLPFMILPIYTVLKKMDVRVVEAAQDLGANGFQVFMRVVLPRSVPGVISGIIMVFMPSATTFVISRLLGGSNFMLFGDLIEQQFLTSANWNFGSALSLIMMVLIVLSIGVMKKFDPEGEGGGMW